VAGPGLTDDMAQGAARRWTKSCLTHADEDPAGRRPGGFRHTPQGILHGATEATRAEFQKKRKPGMHRTATMVGVDTYRPLVPTAEFQRMAG
jgi:hypothetical protein